MKQTNMTIIRGLSLEDDDQKVPELNPDVMHLGLERQKSLMLGNLPDFTSLLESLNTPTLKDNFDFASVINNEITDQSLVEQFNFENIESSFYPESQNPMVAQLKNIRMIERPVIQVADTGATVNYQSNQQHHYQPASPNSVPSPCSSSGYSSDVNTMTIDNETENAHLTMIGEGIQVKIEPGKTDEAGQITMEEFTKRIDRCCSQLNLPRDPSYWSCKQVQQWAIWTSRECYNYDHTSLQHLQVDGTTLCMLNQEDFVSRIGNKELGEILYIDLDIWKNTLCLEARARQAAIAAEMQCQQQQQLDQQQILQQQQQLQQQHIYHSRLSDAEQPVYTDLSHSTPASYTITSIPTPVMTSTDVTLTLNALNQTISHEMYTASQNCGAYQQMSPCSNLGSSGHGGWEESSDSGNSNYGHEYMMADDEDSRASTPLNNHIPSTTTPTIKKSPVVHKKYGAAIGHTKHTIHLWQFLKELLMAPNLYNNCIRWVDQRKGIFKIEDSTRVARLWGDRKNRPAMNYDKLSRSIRQYYKKGIIKKTEQSKRLVYQFCEQYIV